MLLATFLMVVSIAISIAGSLRATTLRWQLEEGHTPYARRKMVRDLRIWSKVWLITVITGVASASGTLAMMYMWFTDRSGSGPATFLVVSCAGLMLVWLVVMIDGYKKYRKAQQWGFLGLQAED